MYGITILEDFKEGEKATWKWMVQSRHKSTFSGLWNSTLGQLHLLPLSTTLTNQILIDHVKTQILIDTKNNVEPHIKEQILIDSHKK